MNRSLSLYGANGNLTGDGTWAYEYDYENRMVSAGKDGINAEYTYDVFGRRIKKEVSDNGQLTTDNYLYDGDQILCEYDGNGTLTKKFIYGPGIDEPIRITTNGSDYYYHFDGLGSVSELTDASGTVVEKYVLKGQAPLNRSLSLYDANGNLVKLERQADAGAAQWQKTEYEYDILDHLVAVKQYLTQNAILDTRYEYDASGNNGK